jgi:hypothetical protein
VNTSRRFPPPWSVDDPDMKLGQYCYIVRDADGHALAYVLSLGSLFVGYLQESI